jgi:hypothetical protein
MPPFTVERLLSSQSEEAVREFLADENNLVLVDWRGDDDAIVHECEAVLQTGDLAAEVVEIDLEPGFEMYISHRGQRVKVPLVLGIGGRHITIHTLNQLLKPDHEIRVCVDLNGMDTLAFLPLSANEWASLESRYGQRVGQHFRKIEEHPNLFTERWATNRNCDNLVVRILSFVRNLLGRGPSD